ncbi:type IV pilus modification protein PilV [Cupriavidus sp. 2SB]|uniref:type IV pilus modification protein PilV n=1 Tax=unclassified Cupriavidus TaxID=2640874 RepID=UPI0010F88DDA|nr:type IV pilus modification protein PilV [Cupriavidus sp. 2SB]
MGQFRCRKAAGFTMLEALVAIVVLAFGVLGVANLLIKSFRFAQQSSYDVVALQLANDMADRMRAHQLLVDGGAFNLDTKLGTPQVSDADNLYKTACLGASTVCQPVSAAFDMAEWSRRVTTTLPGGRAIICRDIGTWSATTGYEWNCSPAANPTNAPLVIKIGWISRFNDSGDAGTPDGTKADGSATVQIVVVVTPGVSS